MNRTNKLLAFLIALVIYYICDRLGMAIIAFLLVEILLKEKLELNRKIFIYIIVAGILFITGHELSLHMALSYFAAPSGNFAWSFIGGFIGGIIELELYLLFTVFPVKLMLCKRIIPSLKYILKVGMACFGIGGFIQGTYMAGWQNLFYI